MSQNNHCFGIQKVKQTEETQRVPVWRRFTEQELLKATENLWREL